MDNLIVIAIVALIVGLAGWYVYRAKKQGAKCIGCPSGGSCAGCSGSCSSCSGCSGNCKSK